MQTSGFDLPLVAQLTAFIALPTKVLVDIVKNAIPKIPSTVLPAVGLVVAFLTALVVLIAMKTTIDMSVVAQCGIAAIGAQVAAMAATSLQTKADKVDERIDTALKADPGTTRTEIDAEVKAKA